MYKICTSHPFNIEQHFIPFLQNNPFLAYISRCVRKRATLSIATAGVSYDATRNELVLWFNPDFMSSLTDARIHGVLKHEFYHIVFGHLTGRRRTPHMRDNIAKDMAINHIVWQEAETNHQQYGERVLTPETYPLPLFGVRPGYFPWCRDPKTGVERDVTAYEHAHRARADARIRGFNPPHDTFDVMPPKAHERSDYVLGEAIKNAPGNMTSEWYFDYLEPFIDENERVVLLRSGNSGSDHVSASIDDHDAWDDVTDDMREQIENDVRNMIRRAVRHADESSSGWGTIPENIRAEIRRSVSNTVDWRSVLRDFMGQAVRANDRTSVRKRNRKYGLAHPGSITGHVAHVVIAIDQSGSVSDELLSEFFSEIEALTRKVTVTILPFDAACSLSDAWTWQKGRNVALDRTKRGGTDFNAPTKVINDNFREQGWEGVVFITDGQCNKPMDCLVRRAWVLSPGDSLAWNESDELIVNMGSGGQQRGAWR